MISDSSFFLGGFHSEMKHVSCDTVLASLWSRCPICPSPYIDVGKKRGLFDSNVAFAQAALLLASSFCMFSLLMDAT